MPTGSPQNANLDSSRPHRPQLPDRFPRTIGPNAMRYLAEVIDGGFSRTDTMVERFEAAFARELGVKHCIATPGCNPALQLLAASLQFEPGDEIVVSPITDYGSIAGIVKENLIPVFADVAPGSVNFSAETIAECITERTRAILAVHMTGLICDMDPINRLAAKHGLVVYEDVCQAIFGQYKGRIAGTLAHAAAFSFDPEKTMGADLGGCLVTDNDELARRARFIGHERGGVQQPGFGRAHVEAGYAFRMPQCTAATCLAQLEIIRDQVLQRDRMVRYLSLLIDEIPGIESLAIPDYVEVFSAWMFSFRIDRQQYACTPDEFAEQLAGEGIAGAGIGKYYLMPLGAAFLNEQAAKAVYPFSTPPASRTYRYDATTCPNALEFVDNWIRWVSFSEKYTPEHCEIASQIVADVACRNRR